jgi:hypothetical protein
MNQKKTDEPLPQIAVMQRISIHFDEWDYTCGDGCCTTFGTRLIMNGKELEHPDASVEDNSYVGDDIQTTLRAVLKELGYEVEFV